MIKPRLISLALLLMAVTGGMSTWMGLSYPTATTLALTVLIATLWVTEAIPIPVTSLIPFIVFPAAGILTVSEASSALGSHVILLLMGAFMLSKAIEKSGVHERIALLSLHTFNINSSRKLVIVFLMVSGLMSMWISNTATTLMLLPIALAVVSRLKLPALTPMLLLGIAYSSSLGGVGTPIGTPPNIIMVTIYEQTFDAELNFIDWMKTGIPVVLIGVPVIAMWLTRHSIPISVLELPALTAWKSAEKRVLWVFLVIALAWIFRPYWTNALGIDSVNDSTVALAGVVLFFLVPNGDKAKPGYLLDWSTAEKIPWGMLLLFAGGICLAKAFVASGLSTLIGESFGALSELPLWLVILLLCLSVSFLTEITSNTATATLLMPILASVAVAINVDPILLMMPAAMSASCAFMMPVATAPNAIVYGAGNISIRKMAREGAVLNVLIAFVITGVLYLTR